MGIVTRGIPTALVDLLRDNYQLDYFVETGTYFAETSIWASSRFARVYTIESAKVLYDDAVRQHGHIENIEFILGDSRQHLAELTARLAAPALFWLDAHWSSGVTAGEHDECPLLEELAVITRSTQQHVLLIDDARLFMSPPPHPYNYKQWPTIADIVETIQAKWHYYMLIHDDVIVAVPETLKEIVAQYCQQLTTLRLEQDEIRRNNAPDRLLANGIGSIKNYLRPVKRFLLRR